MEKRPLTSKDLDSIVRKFYYGLTDEKKEKLQDIVKEFNKK